MFLLYIDETHGGLRGELTAVAGYLFDAAGVERFRTLYQANVEPRLPANQRGVKMFHSAPLFDGHDQFFGIRRELRELILHRMAEAIAESVTMGAVVGVEKAEYERGLRGRFMTLRIEGRPAKTLAPFSGSAYSLCLVRCIHGINSWMDARGLAGPVEYVVELGAKHQDEANHILSAIELHGDFSKKYRFGKHAFVQKGPDTPWLFAADYFAWSWQRNDRWSEGPIDEYGDWMKPLLPLLEAKPHLASYLTEAAVSTQALVHVFNGLVRGPSREAAI